MEYEDFIDNYVRGTLTEIEKEQFESLRENSTIFKNNSGLIEDLIVVSGTEDRHQLRKSIADFESKIAKNTKTTPWFAQKKWIITIAIALLIMGGLAYFDPFAANTDELYTANFKPYKNVVASITRGNGNKNNDEFMAFTSYENQNYELAAMQFDVLFTRTQRSYFLLYHANSLLACNQIKEAILILEKHVTYKDKLSERGKWYLALAYMKEKRKKKAIVLLKEIVLKGAFKKGAASILLKKLE